MNKQSLTRAVFGSTLAALLIILLLGVGAAQANPSMGNSRELSISIMPVEVTVDIGANGQTVFDAEDIRYLNQAGRIGPVVTRRQTSRLETG